MNNKIIFFKNGVSQGIAYQGPEIKPGIYFPAISIYMQVISFLKQFLYCFAVSMIEIFSNIC